jgi:hypothetical protein
MLGTIANAVTRPYAYSVIPQQTETLTIRAAAVLGSQTVTAPERTPKPVMTLTKHTVSRDEYLAPSPGAAAPTPTPSPTKVSTTDEQTLLPAPRTIYDLSEKLVEDSNLSEGWIRAHEGLSRLLQTIVHERPDRLVGGGVSAQSSCATLFSCEQSLLPVR